MCLATEGRYVGWQCPTGPTNPVTHGSTEPQGERYIKTLKLIVPTSFCSVNISASFLQDFRIFFYWSDKSSVATSASKEPHFQLFLSNHILTLPGSNPFFLFL